MSEMRSIMLKRALIHFFRGFIGRCPNCGASGIFRSWFEMYPDCYECGLRFEREEGYWTGAMGVNIIMTELIFGAVLVTVVVLTWPSPPMWPLLIVGLLLNGLFPVFFYPYSKTVWMAFDLTVNPIENRHSSSDS